MRSLAVWTLLGALLLFPTLAAGQAGGEAREVDKEGKTSGRDEMESFEGRLDDAVGRVSVPHAGILLGRASTSRGYRLPGYGVVFVLTPRSLPGEEPVFVVRRRAGRGGPGLQVEPHEDPAAGAWHWVPENVEELEREVLVLQHAAEARRRAAEEDMDRMVEDIRVRLEVKEERGSAPSGSHDVTVRVDSQVPPPDESLDDEMLEPPWKFWLKVETDEERRSPDRVVEDVCSAVIGALDARAGAAVGLSADEFVTVAVDFVPGDLFASHRRPTRTLIVRARQRDLEAQAQGTIPPEELRDRVEVIEY